MLIRGWQSPRSLSVSLCSTTDTVTPQNWSAAAGRPQPASNADLTTQCFRKYCSAVHMWVMSTLEYLLWIELWYLLFKTIFKKLLLCSNVRPHVIFLGWRQNRHHKLTPELTTIKTKALPQNGSGCHRNDPPPSRAVFTWRGGVAAKGSLLALRAPAEHP